MRCFRSNTILSYSLTLLILMGCGSEKKYINEEVSPFSDSYLVGEAPPDRSLSFDDYFVATDTIRLSAEPVLSSLSSLDIDKQGRLLVADMRGAQVVLYDPEGNHIKTLSAHPCHPGFNWAPTAAYFTPEPGILVLNNGPWGYRFSIQGECVGSVDDSFRPARWVSFDSTGAMFGFYVGPDSYSLRKMDQTGREELTFGQAEHWAQFTARFAGGGAVHDGRYLYVALPTRPYAYRFKSNGNYAGAIGFAPSYYRALEKDIRDFTGDPGEILEEVSKVQDQISVTLSLFGLDHNSLLFVYRNTYKYKNKPNEEIGVAVIDTLGQSLIPGEIQTDRRGWFLSARDGKAYQGLLPSSEAQESSYGLVVYQFVQRPR